MPTRLRSGETLLFIGDSITDCGRRDAQHAPLGVGYVKFFHDMLLIREPEKQVRIINTGIGGNTVEDLRTRWRDDALSHRPDWLSVKIGINDANRFLTNPQQHAMQGPEPYAEIFEQILDLTRQELPETRLMLIDPFFASLDQRGGTKGSYRARVSELLPQYHATIDRLARKYQAVHVRTHDVFHAHFQHQHPSVYFPNEPVHPNQAGHLLIAEAVYAAMSEGQ